MYELFVHEFIRPDTLNEIIHAILRAFNPIIMTKITIALILIATTSFGQTRKPSTPIIMSHNLLDLVITDTMGRHPLSTPLNKLIPELDSMMNKKFMGTKRLPGTFSFGFQ